MAAPVRVEASALSDPRIDLLGQLAGYSRYEALGRLTHLWSACTEKQTHVASEALVRACIGPAGVQHMLEAELAERAEGGLRIRGTDGRIEWLGEFSERGAGAGKARAATAKRDSRGRLMSSKSPAHAGGASASDEDADQHTSTRPACAGDAGPSTSSTHQQASSGGPAESSALTPTLTPDQSVGPDARAPARPTGFVDRRARLTHEAWAQAAKAHAALRDRGVDPNARPYPGLPVGQGASEIAARVLQLTAGDPPDYTQAEQALAHVIAVRVAEAERTQSLRWFAPSTMWASVAFWRAVDMTVEDARSGPPPKDVGAAAAPKKPANVGRVEPSAPSAYGSGRQTL